MWKTVKRFQTLTLFSPKYSGAETTKKNGELLKIFKSREIKNKTICYQECFTKSY